jgi:hypothetical protein
MHRRAFAIDKPLRLPPNAFFSLEANAPHIMLQTTPLFPRALAFEGRLPLQVPLPWKELFIALTFQGLLPLPSKCLCLCFRSAFAFALDAPFPLSSKGLCHQRAFAIEGPLPSKGLCHRRAFSFKAP